MAITEGLTGLGASQSNVASTWVTVGISGGFTAGRCCVMNIALSDASVSVSSLNDDTQGGSMSFSQRTASNFNGIRHEMWVTATNGTLTSGSFVKVNLTGSSLAAATLSEWAGVLQLGLTNTVTSTVANPIISLVTQDANNYVVAGFCTVGNTLPTSSTGTLDREIASSGSSPVACTLTNNTAATATTVNNAVNLAGTTWIAAALELRSAASAGGTRQSLMMVGIG